MVDCLAGWQTDQPTPTREFLLAQQSTVWRQTDQILSIRQRRQSQQPTIPGTIAKLTAGTTHQNNQPALRCCEQGSAANTMASDHLEARNIPTSVYRNRTEVAIMRNATD